MPLEGFRQHGERPTRFRCNEHRAGKGKLDFGANKKLKGSVTGLEIELSLEFFRVEIGIYPF